MSGEPPYQTNLQPIRLDRITYAVTTTILFAILNAAKLRPYWINGQIDLSSTKAGTYLAVPAIVGVLWEKEL